MDNFEIKDAQRLLSQAGDLAQINQNIMRVKEQIADRVNMIDGAWQSDTEDRESYLGEIKKNLVKLGTLGNAVGSLASQLTNFAEQSIRVANNG